MNKTVYIVFFAFFSFLCNVSAQVTGSGDMWTWMHGESSTLTPVVFGTQGVAAPANRPCGTYTPGVWTAPNGIFWMFGGENGGTKLDNLWKFDPVSNQWTWVSGSGAAVNQTGSYGTRGVAAATNLPPARYAPVCWADPTGILWMFGGLGPTGFFNDLWKYDPGTNQWTWVSGSNVINHVGSYGTLGVPAANNLPSARQSSGSWIDAAGDLWLFGGYSNGVNSLGQVGFSDLWKYNPATDRWTWVAGPNTNGNAGIYGTRGTPAAANNPAARNSPLSWVDNAGNFWMFGGQKYGSGFQGLLSDLWKYDPVLGQWAWMNGTQSVNLNGVYGIQSVPTPVSAPGGRFNMAGWKDVNGDLWLFGGTGYAGTGSSSNLNDLWRYSLATNRWTWMKGSDQPDQYGVYGTKGLPDVANAPGGRGSIIGWRDLTGNFWLFGGSGLATTGAAGYLNDVWRLSPCGNTQALVSGILGRDTSFCYGKSYTLDATFAGATYLWSTGVTTPTITVNSSGDYWVRILTSGGCPGWDTAKVTVIPLPVVNLGPDQMICSSSFPITLYSPQPAGSDYLWSNGLSDTMLTVIHDNKYWLRVSYFGCVSSDTVQITSMMDPDVNIGTDTTICMSIPAKIGMEVPGAAYLWSTGSTDPFIYVSITDNYWLQVDLSGCIVGDTTQVTAMPSPEVDLGPDSDICPGQEFILYAGPGTRFSWGTGDTTENYKVKKAGEYTVTVQSEYGCTGTDTIRFNPKFLPTVSLQEDTSVCEETPLILSAFATNADEFAWSDGSSGAIHQVTSGGVYIVAATNPCGTAYDTIEVRQIFCDIWVPNVFTPNGDGINDVFKILGNTGKMQGFGLNIYNRWGQRVFNTSDKYQGWDGLHNGNPALLGTYVYMLEYNFEGVPFVQKGNFLLIR